MKITVTKTYELTYSVECFHSAEGGMDHGTFGVPVKTIEEAVMLLDMAKTPSPTNYNHKDEWVIVVQVETKLTGEKK
jgi:hypothetical protein